MFHMKHAFVYFTTLSNVSCETIFQTIQYFSDLLYNELLLIWTELSFHKYKRNGQKKIIPNI